ncbi:holo-ACP synthase [Helicobacter valdiviensis]|uniref:Holo-[acyl-carrier-protein] synthase n=1 Tax=Helicobacter valdiviensis TaxID=1458358 RepID=A0A2W6MXM5_9HELI|nr:holo-ACP synthase [Helicobacter valdiviensis]PZT48691.1 holo-ACP synthase [Helicobacter valdiviensis]
MIDIGVDIVAISRIASYVEKFGEKGLLKFLLPSEIGIANKIETIAGFWAAKEACAKALRCGIGKELSFKDMQISKDNANAPFLILSKEKQEYFQISSLSLSITHDGGFAIAVVVSCRKSS